MSGTAEADSGNSPVPDSAAQLTTAREQRNAGRLDDAEATCRTVLEFSPDDAEAHALLGSILRLQHRGAAAIASLRKAASLDSGNPKRLVRLAIALSEQGHMAEAIDLDRRALSLDPRHVAALSHLARLKKFQAGDADLAALEQAAREANGLPESKRAVLFFALAKAYDDTGDYERAFHCLVRANGLKRAGMEYDVSRDIRLFDEIISVFNADLVARFEHAGSTSDLPILIVGMPRSGTTLVEQVLASHPAVHGGGELPDLEEMAVVPSVMSASGRSFPHAVAELAPADLAKLGQGYVSRLGRSAPGSVRVTDKTPMNFRYLGFARLIVPRARVIHCMRDPLDTCLSCYSLPFTGVDFSYDLLELGRYYRGYAKLMDHWRSVLPGEWMLDVQYENLVEDIEREARRIVAHCGLEWEDSCLDFHATERNVQTASFAQVREPLYRGSVGRSRRYEPYIRPLIDVLYGNGERTTAARAAETR